MSYESGFGGLASFHGGFGYYGLSGIYPIRQPDAGMRDLQQQLQRLGYLQQGGGIYGADGKFGPRTANALRSAAAYVGWTGAAYSPSDAAEKRSGTVTVPDDLLQRLRSASPNPNAPFASGDPVPAPDAPAEPDEERRVIGPHLDPKPAAAGRSDDKWIIAAVAGAAILGVGGIIAYRMRTQRRPVAANRRRHSSRRRRRR